MSRDARAFRPIAADNRTVSGTISAAGEVVGSYRYRKQITDRETNQVHFHLSGTWVGTMLLQTSYPDRGEWTTVTDGTFTANASEGLTLGGSIDIRVYCSAYTSGTCFAALSNT